MHCSSHPARRLYLRRGPAASDGDDALPNPVAIAVLRHVACYAIARRAVLALQRFADQRVNVASMECNRSPVCL